LFSSVNVGSAGTDPKITRLISALRDARALRLHEQIDRSPAAESPKTDRTMDRLLRAGRHPLEDHASSLAVIAS
jgi:hypothetical protein